MKKHYIIFAIAGLAGAFLQNGTVSRVLGNSAPQGVASSNTELRALMEKDAAVMAARIREAYAATKSLEGKLATPKIDVMNRRIDFQIIIRLGPIELEQTAIERMVRFAQATTCPLYEQTRLGGHGVTVHQTSYFNDGTPVFSFDLDHTICSSAHGRLGHMD